MAASLQSEHSHVDFLAVDLPDAITLSIGIFAVQARHVRELVSSRTKAALQAKRPKGTAFSLDSLLHLKILGNRRNFVGLPALAGGTQMDAGEIRPQAQQQQSVPGKSFN